MSEYIGSRISLISKSDIRYVGTLVEINSENSTVALENVMSYGTEERRTGDDSFPPSSSLYDYILFRGSDVKDLRIEEPPKETSTQPKMPDDPAILGSARPAKSSEPPQSQPSQSGQQNQQPPQGQQSQQPPQGQQAPSQPPQGPHGPTNFSQPPPQYNQYPPPYGGPLPPHGFGRGGFPGGGPGFPHGYPGPPFGGPGGPPPGWYPPPGQGFHPGPGGFSPQPPGMPIGPPGLQQQAPQQDTIAPQPQQGNKEGKAVEKDTDVKATKAPEPKAAAKGPPPPSSRSQMLQLLWLPRQGRN